MMKDFNQTMQSIKPFEITTKIIDAYGEPSIHGRLVFQTIGSKITEEIAMKEQTKLGFPPQGYGFFRFIVSENGKYATWECARSCD